HGAAHPENQGGLHGQYRSGFAGGRNIGTTRGGRLQIQGIPGRYPSPGSGLAAETVPNRERHGNEASAFDGYSFFRSPRAQERHGPFSVRVGGARSNSGFSRRQVPAAFADEGPRFLRLSQLGEPDLGGITLVSEQEVGLGGPFGLL